MKRIVHITKITSSTKKYSYSTGIIDKLKERKLYYASTNHIESILNQQSNVGIYAGFDPTANGLHVGNLIILQTLKLFQKQNFNIFALIGGSTGLIGDPSGKNTTRPLMSEEILNENVHSIQTEIQKYFNNNVQILNNSDWLRNMNVIDLLRENGKYFNVNKLLGLESIKTRLQSDGMTFTEFSYPIFQSFDFFHLYKNHNVKVQIGGSDQWGNIISGMEFIHKKEELSDLVSGGITIPLLTTSDGKKFGKSEGNAIWLNSEKTSYFDFYQFFVRSKDEDVEKLLFIFTDLLKDDIGEIMNEHEKYPEKKVAQIKLASEITKEIHGIVGLEKAKFSSEILFGNESFDKLESKDIEMLFKDAPCSTLSDSILFSSPISTIAREAKMFKSSNQVTKLIKEGGFYVNNNKIESEKFSLTMNDFINDQFVVLRSGKKKYHIIKRV
eukprot:gene1977-1485_t